MTRDGSGFLNLFELFILGFFRVPLGRGLVLDFEVIFGTFEVLRDFFASVWVKDLGFGVLRLALEDFSKRFGVDSPFVRDFGGFFGRFLSRYFCMSRAAGGFLD